MIIIINNWFLCSAFQIKIKVLHSILLPPVIGFRINSALTVHFLHSLGSIPASRHFRILPGAHLYLSKPNATVSPRKAVL